MTDNFLCLFFWPLIYFMGGFLGGIGVAVIKYHDKVRPPKNQE